MINAFISGFLLGISLILPIGAQNAFVLRQGIKKEFIFLVCLICAFSDALMIWAGILGFGVAIQKFQYYRNICKIFCVYIFIYLLFKKLLLVI
ncbi:LysE/ArgO family amino acid transporter [Campylobacter hyointestinalis]|uniref:LysE/ArgO family amino acid transporter n=1 Tax=Campylobacter hyointestinalis TaxID=198 RepID=UPI000AB08727|nr:LysE family transporter [Campylobacter hyointestinalis]